MIPVPVRRDGIQGLEYVLHLLARWFNKAAPMLLIKFLHLPRIHHHLRGRAAGIPPDLLAFHHCRSKRLFGFLNLLAAGVNNHLPGAFYRHPKMIGCFMWLSWAFSNGAITFRIPAEFANQVGRLGLCQYMLRLVAVIAQESELLPRCWPVGPIHTRRSAVFEWLIDVRNTLLGRSWQGFSGSRISAHELN